ncbi:hypothetical protein X777_13221 [Ooceraea biroi]|uniref:Uncharacterized protein n=1 Tax=Ooceraea biroi TaxID=2015173 RepID=A0A026VYL8_OOCBI|nr:hypothetical protein X777_13221 [Ooceraea biroi]
MELRLGFHDALRASEPPERGRRRTRTKTNEMRRSERYTRTCSSWRMFILRSGQPPNLIVC